jgi:hypothetical protein
MYLAREPARDRTPQSPRWPLAVRRIAGLTRSQHLRSRLAAATALPSMTWPVSSVRKPSRPPVFVLSAGWRSGSTAMQRLIVSGGEAFLWGEPYPTSRLIPRLERIAVESVVRDVSADRIVGGDEFDASLSRTWLATSNPEASQLMTGFRSLLETTYWGPLANTTFATWGTKEVALTAGQLEFLMTLFPEASFVCLVRDPVAAYLSFREFIVNGVAPSGRADAGLGTVAGPVGFARIWRQMAAKFRAVEHLENVFVHRYEDIDSARDFPTLLGRQLDMTLDPEAWSLRLGAATWHRGSLFAEAEASIVRRLTRSESERWGYA